MKKINTHLMWVLLTLLCITGLMVPASAFDSDAFREKNSDALEARGISLYGMQEFREGLMPVLVNDQWNYINEQLQVVDLNKNRFTYVFPFFDGLAAVVDENDKVGYINKSGTIIIPCKYGAVFSQGMVYTGYFNNGNVVVLEESYWPEYFYADPNTAWTIGRLDQKGNVTQEFTWIEAGVQGLHMIADNGYMADEVNYEDEPQKVTFIIDRYTPPIWVHNPDSDFTLADGASYAATVTNHTGSSLHSYYALVSYQPTLTLWTGTLRFTGQIHFFDVELAAGEIKQLSFTSQFSNLASGDYRFLWLEFEDAAEMKEFQNNAPLDQYYGRALDESTGAAWMQTELGITIQK